MALLLLGRIKAAWIRSVETINPESFTRVATDRFRGWSPTWRQAVTGEELFPGAAYSAQ
jgi:hypothetical protein